LKRPKFRVRIRAKIGAGKASGKTRANRRLLGNDATISAGYGESALEHHQFGTKIGRQRSAQNTLKFGSRLAERLPH
jgi:hypothetical protein